MATITLSLSLDSIQQQVRKTIGELYSSAETIRQVATAVEGTVGEVLADAAPEQLRQIAAIVRSHTAFVLLSAVNLGSKAERLETIADIRDAADERESPAGEAAAQADPRSPTTETATSPSEEAEQGPRDGDEPT